MRAKTYAEVGPSFSKTPAQEPSAPKFGFHPCHFDTAQSVSDVDRTYGVGFAVGYLYRNDAEFDVASCRVSSPCFPMIDH